MRTHKRYIIYIISLLLMIVSFSTTTKADTAGPIPYAIITIEGIGNEKCYYTLLYETNISESYENNIPIQGYAETQSEKEILNAFMNYKDEDGYYFINDFRRISEKTVRWEWPSKRFKILIYVPENRTYIVSNICEDYAYDSYYTISVAEVIGEQDSIVNAQAHRSYNYKREGFQLILRVMATLLIEMLLALLFGYKEKRQILVIFVANLVTQVILNIYLNVFTYLQGPWLLTFIPLLVGEIGVFLLEAVIYSLCLNRVAINKKPMNRAVLNAVAYAFLANVISFLLSGVYVLTSSNEAVPSIIPFF